MNISKWSAMKRNVVSIIILLIIWLLWNGIAGTTQATNRVFVLLAIVVLIWNSVFGMNDATRKIVNLPDSKIKIVNNGDNDFEVNVKMGSSSTSYANVDSKVIKKSPVYYTTAYLASSKRKVAKLSVPIEIALFNREGELKKIENIPAKTETRINIEKEVKHIIMAPEGFFAGKNISKDNNSKLVV